MITWRQDGKFDITAISDRTHCEYELSAGSTAGSWYVTNLSDTNPETVFIVGTAQARRYVEQADKRQAKVAVK